MPRRRIVTAREQLEMLSPWRLASGFDPFKVTHRLRDEFHDWFGQQYQQDPSRYSDKQWGAGMSHWPVIEDFLKDKYPAAHRGLMTGREDASALLDYPEASGIMSRYDDETGSEIAPYSSADHHKLGYDPSEVAAGMVLLHNQNRDGLSNGYLDDDKDRLVDIFNKRQQMQRNYEQRQTTASFLPPDTYHWDLDWSQANESSSFPLSELQHRQYPDTRRPQGRFNVQKMPPIKVLFHNDLHWIMDGHHRAQWAARNGITHVPALILDSQQQGVTDASH